jgi:DNA-binding NarL/FixJ family response regulator
MRAMRRHFDAQFKAEIVQQVLREEKTIAEIASEHEIHPNQIKRWKATMVKGLPSLFSDETTSLKAARPETIVLILTAYEDAELLRAAMSAGAAGYVVKWAAEPDLLEAIRAVRRGEVYIHPALTRALLTAEATPQAKPEAKPQAEEPVEPLTQRELEVLKLVALGYTTAEIGAQLSLSARTVEHYRANLKDKMGVRTRAELTRYAAEHGLMPPDEALR